jgi:hypothetical protein
MLWPLLLLDATKPVPISIATFPGTPVSNQLPGALLYVRVKAKLINH